MDARAGFHAMAWNMLNVNDKTLPDPGWSFVPFSAGMTVLMTLAIMPERIPDGLIPRYEVTTLLALASGPFALMGLSMGFLSGRRTVYRDALCAAALAAVPILWWRLGFLCIYINSLWPPTRPVDPAYEQVVAACVCTLSLALGTTAVGCGIGRALNSRVTQQ